MFVLYGNTTSDEKISLAATNHSSLKNCQILVLLSRKSTHEIFFLPSVGEEKDFFTHVGGSDLGLVYLYSFSFTF